jgi:hypothetical protein
MVFSPLYDIKNSTMKKALLIAITIWYAFTVNAQKHVATPTPVKKIAFDKHSLTKKPMAAACDTLKFDSAFSETKPWTASYYPLDDLGYIFGTGSIEDYANFSVNENANYYDVSSSDYTYITGGLAQFAYANSNKPANLSKNLVFKVYDDNGSGLPGNLLGSTNFKLSQVKDEVINGLYTAEFKFSTPIAIPANKIFYVSIDLTNFDWNTNTKDSIAIIVNSPDEAPAAAFQNITDIVNNTYWAPVNQNWTTDGTTPLNVALFLFPYVSNSPDGSCSVLPVSILDFKGSINDNKALLTWSTATEFNNTGFAVERSKDGKAFTQIGFVNGAGTTTQRKDYTFTDATLSDIGVATMYYRLKQIDKDGKTSYSKVIPLSLRNILDWKIYPNPVKDKLTVELNLTADTKVNVQVISKDGRVLLNADKGTLPQGLQQLNFNVQNIAAGSYFVRVKAGEKSCVQMIVKQ